MLLNHFERLQSLPVFGCILIEQFLQFRVFESFWPSFTSTVINIEIIVFKRTEPITTRWSDVFTQLKVYDSTMKHVKTVCLPYVAWRLRYVKIDQQLSLERQTQLWILLFGSIYHFPETKHTMRFNNNILKVELIFGTLG